MRYFIVAEDDRIQGRVEPVGISEAIRKDMFSEKSAQEQDNRTFQFSIRDQSAVEYVDWLERPLPLISDRLKQLFIQIDPDIEAVPLVLTDMKRVRQELYWAIKPPLIECLSEQSEFRKDGTLKRLVICNHQANRPIFQMKGIVEKHIFIHLAVAESMLRRDYRGIRLRRVETEVEEW